MTAPCDTRDPSACRRLLWLVPLALMGLTCAAVIWYFDPRTWHLPLCMFHAMTGLHCPGCGGTRAVHELLHGRMLSALRYNPVFVVGAPLVAYGLLSQIRMQGWDRPLPGDPLQRRWFITALAIVVVAFGILRNIPIYPLVLLAPPG